MYKIDYASITFVTTLCTCTPPLCKNPKPQAQLRDRLQPNDKFGKLSNQMNTVATLGRDKNWQQNADSMHVTSSLVPQLLQAC